MFLKYKIKNIFKSFRHHISPHVFEEVLLKKNGLCANIDKIEVLAMGSSHCARSFDSNIIKNSYNLGIMDQDLYTTYCIYNMYINSLKNLKQLILFYSIHSQGHELKKTNSYKTMAIHNAIFGITYPVKEILKYKKSIKKRFKKFNDLHIDYKNFTGYTLDKRKIVPTSAEFRVFHHLKENKRATKQNNYLFQIAKECLKRNIKITIVISPARSDYISELEKTNITDNELFHEIIQWCKKYNIPILNELRSQYYTWNDFLDSDHLSQKGAIKLTKKIANFIHLKTK